MSTTQLFSVRQGLHLTAVLVAASLSAAVALAQEPETPVLPETRVVAEPPVAEFVPDDGLTGTILDGTIFMNPPALGYGASTSTTGSIIAIPDADLPLTVSPITRAVLDDQIAIRVTDIFRNAGGVNLIGDGQFADRLLIRGQRVGGQNFRKDGFLDRTSVPREFQNVERIEILKGPASVLYGAGDAAGLVNLITKKPLNDQFTNFGYTFGSFNQSRFILDTNGIATSSGNVLYRLNAAQEDTDSFVDFDYVSRTQIAPVVTWLIDDCTTLTWNGEWHRDHRIGFQGTPAVFGNPLFLPPSRYVGEPANDFFAGEEFRQSLVLTHQINEDWFFSIGGYSLFNQSPLSTTSAQSFAPVIPNPPQPFFNRQRIDAPSFEEQTQSMIANLGGEFCTGEFYHRSLVGMEYAYLDSRQPFFAGLPLSLFNVTDPVYTNPPAFPLFGLNTNAFRQQRVGGYLQDLVQINPYWQVLGAVRFDTVDLLFDRDVIGLAPVPLHLVTEQNFQRVTPRGGVIYQPYGDESLAFYYSYTESFSPPPGGAYFDLSPLKPVLGQSHEAGIKTQLLDGLSLTACGYYINRENDAFNLNPSVLTQVGAVRSQGAELNLLGQITDLWSVVGNYCYCDAKTFDAALGLNGAPARNVPFNTANLWTRYNLYDDCCETLGAALGIVYVGDRASAVIPNSIDLPQFTRWDAGLYYRRGQLNTAVYFENIFDTQYAQSSINEYQVFQGAPFNVRATLSYLY